MKDYLDLNEMQLDALKEISNIGAGNAATSLSIMLGRKIGLSVPKATLAPFAQIVEVVGGAEKEVAGGYLSVDGDTPMGILFLLSRDQVPSFLDLLFGAMITPIVNSQEDFMLNEIQESALKEIVNILAGSYLNALGVFTQHVFIPSVPALAIDMAGAILGEVLQSIGNVSDYALIIENMFCEEKKQISAYFFFLPEPQTLKILLNALGV
ncbi:MAG: chemotaxis protein CheC [Clostridia bacterium]|nr:chemotaxis protein CheC [Clostridia bacterium]MDD4145546.1 chemotaxis protein CheC [Clostridia bacterium]MDD4664978.1 chemotaxis protein CheC [Clostridia bacterium]